MKYLLVLREEKVYQKGFNLKKIEWHSSFSLDDAHKKQRKIHLS